MDTDLPELLKGKKASLVFLEYVEPYLNSYMQERPGADIEELNTVLKAPWVIWNAVVGNAGMPHFLGYLETIKKITADATPEEKRMLNELEQRKRSQFGQYKYFLGEVCLYKNEKTNELIMKAEAKDPARMEEITLH